MLTEEKESKSKDKKYFQDLTDRIKQIKESEKREGMTEISKFPVQVNQGSMIPLEETGKSGGIAY